MDEYGSGTSEKRIELLREAAKELVETLALQASQMKQIDKPVQFGIVPFSASVNVGPDNDDKTWMDTTGISPIHHENFDWSKMTQTDKRQPSRRPVCREGRRRLVQARRRLGRSAKTSR